MKFDHKYLGYNTDKNRDEYLCNIYNIKNTLVGYCKYYTGDFIIEPHVVYIEFINITYEYRRRGYGTKLVKELMSKYELKWDNRFSEDGKKWYKKLIERGII